MQRPASGCVTRTPRNTRQREASISHHGSGQAGAGLLSLQTLEMELALKRLAVLKVEGFPIMRHWYIVHRADKRLSPVALAFKNFLLDEAITVLSLQAPS